MSININQLNKINDYLWEIPCGFRSDMRVPARVYASREMLIDISRDRSLEQLMNVATLPGIKKYAVLMPDAHEGYGFPIGGVAATSYPDGIISPGGIGYDINCGVRLLITDLNFNEIKELADKVARQLYEQIPSGVGRGGWLKLSKSDLDRVLNKGVDIILERGYGSQEDKKRIESGGLLPEAKAEYVSQRAKERGRGQLGTMGAGNHFVEVDRVAEIFSPEVAAVFGLRLDQVVILIHTGSRGLGHQVATDYIRLFLRKLGDYGVNLPDRELAGVPLATAEGGRYFGAMAAAANFAWANRQLITWEVRQVFERVFGKQAGSLPIVYDVAHNIAKLEEYEIEGKKQKLIVHRKGATRAFGPQRKELPAVYQQVGQPVLIPGSMGTCSYVLVGTEAAREQSFSSSCHGAGRVMSRRQAKREIQVEQLTAKLSQQGITIAAGSKTGVAEEAPQAYKDVSQVVEVVHQAGIANKVAKLVPWVVVKG